MAVSSVRGPDDQWLLSSPLYNGVEMHKLVWLGLSLHVWVMCGLRMTFRDAPPHTAFWWLCFIAHSFVVSHCLLWFCLQQCTLCDIKERVWKQNRQYSLHGAGLMQVAGLPDIKIKKQPDKLVDKNSSQGSSQAATEWSPQAFMLCASNWGRLTPIAKEWGWYVLTLALEREVTIVE